MQDSTGSNSTRRTVTCFRAFSRRSRTCVKTNTAGTSRRARAFPCACSRPCAPNGRHTSRCRSESPRMTGWTAGILPTMRLKSRECFAAGADVIDVSAGQVVNNERPVFGRMWMTPFADRIRQEACIATMAVGAITDADQANGIIASGRADLVAVGRPHLVNPAWTLSEAARWGYQGATWPDQYLAGKHQLERVIARERAMAGAAAAPAGPPRGELT